MRGLIVVSCVLALGGCSAAGQVRDGFGDAAMTPLTDLNVRREQIPTVLLQAQANPYDRRNLNQCTTIGAEVARLDEALGPDRDEPAAPDNPTLNERTQDALAEAALDAIRNAATDFIPYRSWVRALSGAQARSKTVQDAVEAGRLRRAFLKGLGMKANCAPPASPAWFRPTGRSQR
ncbi:MAG: hypothetical protein KKA16_08290 [Alphaproteobacteria bacterium]|nr:hypothetical protein [Alphaproteobacteria bacterium]MBU2379237.1 hypothetical protein [Alphaproteobacteria bacterium]